MHLSNINKFSFPILFNKGYFSKMVEKVKKTSNPTILGRWSLKHEEKDLNTFYRYIPDPGYPNLYPDSMNAGYEPLYNRSGKPQK